jgi:hypothetical protein
MGTQKVLRVESTIGHGAPGAESAFKSSFPFGTRARNGEESVISIFVFP